MLGLNQYVTLPTRQTNILDLVLVRGVKDVYAVPCVSNIVSDHDEVAVSFAANTAFRPVCDKRSVISDPRL